MAWSTVETKIANPASGGRVRRKGNKKNMAKRHLSAKQIKAGFGGKRRRAALKTKRHSTHRKRTNAARKRAAPREHHRKRTNAAPRRHREKAAAAAPVRRHPKKNSSHRAPRKSRKNPELVSFLIGNPATKRRKKGMARHSTKRKKSAASRSNAGTRRRSRKGTVRHHRHRRNPALAGLRPMQFLELGAGGLAGFLGSAAIPNFFGASTNTGMTGYALSAAAAVGVTILASMVFPKKPMIAAGAAAGGVANLLRRVLTDQTPFGAYLNAPVASGGMGMGDYMTANWGPPRMSDGLHSAMAEAPGTPWNSGGMLTTSSGINTQDLMDIRSARPC